MNINRDEALRAKDLAEGLMKKADFTGARKLALKANKMDPTLENITHMTMVCDVHCAATEKVFGNELDWYGILQVEMNADDIGIKKQYRRLALLLHPDKNKLPGAESAFKLIGEAQRMLLDKDKRSVYDIKRRAWRKPAPAPSYRTQQVPRNRAQQASVNLRNVYNELRSENRHHPRQKAPQAPPPAAFSLRPTFWTSCPFCRMRYEYKRESIMKETTCLACKKQFTALEIPFQYVPPPATNSSQTSSTFPHHNKVPAQNACNEPQKRPPPDGPPPTVPSGKAKANGKRKRKNKNDSSESSDSDSDSETEDNAFGDTRAAHGLGSNGGQQPRRSVRSKRQVSYKENLKDDDVDLVNEDGEGSGKNIDAEKEEELEDKKQTLEDHNSTETLPNGINPKEEIKEDQVKVESEDSASDSEDDVCSESEAKPNVISCDDPEFSDFDKLRAEDCFKAGQIWALYDDGEGMPRFYGLIKQAKTSPVFLVTYMWLESEEDEEARSLPVSVGNYKLGGEEKTDNTAVFSHFVQIKIGRARHFKVFPKKGETWALFKNWNKDLPSDTSHEYEFVEILSEYAEESPISVGFLSKVEGFKFVFCPAAKDGSYTCEIPPHEFCRFSHGVPSNRLKETEGRGVLEGWYELDPAAVPIPGSQNIPGEDHQSPPSGSDC